MFERGLVLLPCGRVVDARFELGRFGYAGTASKQACTGKEEQMAQGSAAGCKLRHDGSFHEVKRSMVSLSSSSSGCSTSDSDQMRRASSCRPFCQSTSPRWAAT